jgi:hypothetical protein
MTPIFTNLDEKCIEIFLKFITKRQNLSATCSEKLVFAKFSRKYLFFAVVFGLSMCETGAKALLQLEMSVFFVKI